MSGLSDAVGPMVAGILLIGALLGIVIAGIGWFLYWLCCHIHIVWIP